MKKLFTLLLVLITCSVSAIDMGPYDPGAARKSDLGTISTKADTDYVATSALALRLDTVNASFTGDIDVTGDVGAATLGVTGHSTLTTASATHLTISGTLQTTRTYVYAKQASSFSVAGAWVIASASTEVTDVLSEYNPTTSTFTPAETGDYMVCWKYFISGEPATTTVQISATLAINGTRTDSEYRDINNVADIYNHGMELWPIRLTAGVPVRLEISCSTGGTVTAIQGSANYHTGIRIWRIN